MFRQEQLSTRAQTFRATRYAICDLDAFLSDTYGMDDGIAPADVMTEHSLSPLLALVKDIADVDEIVQVVPQHEYIVQGLDTTVDDISYTIVHCMHSRHQYDPVECWLRRNSRYRIQSIQHLQPIQYASGRFDRLVENRNHCQEVIAEVFGSG